jgi:hypothetical protein
MTFCGFFGSMHCKWCTGLSVWCLRDSTYFPISFAMSEPAGKPLKCRDCFRPSVEDRRLCQRHLESDRARKQKRKAALQAQQPETEPPQAPPIPAGPAQTTTRHVRPREEAVTAVNKPEKKRQRRHLVSQDRGLRDRGEANPS